MEDKDQREHDEWMLDHPDGFISAEERESMDRYAVEACAAEGCRDDEGRG